MFAGTSKYSEGQKVMYRGEPFQILAVSMDQTKLVIGTDRRTVFVSSEEVMNLLEA